MPLRATAMHEQLSLAQIRANAVRFAHDWQAASREDGDAKPFWIDFFKVFGVTQRRVASFEHPVNVAGAHGRIDLLWKGLLLVEHKSRGKDLDTAYRQAIGYFPGIQERDLPRYLIVSDFARLRLYDLDLDTQEEILLEQLPERIDLFGFMTGRQKRTLDKQAAVNVEAVARLGELHDRMDDVGYGGQELQMFMIRLLFCLFAEDTGIFPRNAFRDLVETTRADGSDLDGTLMRLFDTLNRPVERRIKTLHPALAEFPYVNGRLFAEPLPTMQFDQAMRDALLDCTALDWSQISPAIFGALFQSIMNREERRANGAHYTAENNILKALNPLFLDRLRAELDQARRSRNLLIEFQKRLANTTVLDPACGCGNFLIVAYRELRLIELEVVRALHAHARDTQGGVLDIRHLVQVDVHQFHGIELDEWPAHIAQVAMWLMDHILNMQVQQEFGQNFIRIPLKHAPQIITANALATDWAKVLPPEKCAYVVGNPPFRGPKFMDARQKAEAEQVVGELKSWGLLDYVCTWFVQATRYMLAAPEHQRPRCALVSTNSITQGEQVAPLWGWLLQKGVTIQFAHRTFAWSSEAKGKAAVHCVIIGFGIGDAPGQKTLVEYADARAEGRPMVVSQINPYLVDAPAVFLERRSEPLCAVPPMVSGNKPIDGGHYLFTPDEKTQFIQREPAAEPYFRKWLGGEEFLNGIERWCLWLCQAPPDTLARLTECKRRIEAVRAFRLASPSTPTQKLADRPREFHTTFASAGRYIALPEVSSERRKFIPTAFLDTATLCSNKLRLVDNASLYHFGILTSTMHNAWVRCVTGRLKSDIQYSALIVYNNFPWPQQIDQAKQDAIGHAAQAVLDARDAHPDSTLAQLYDPLAMPTNLQRAHQALDKLVDAAYRKKRFTDDADRVAHLFSLYQDLTKSTEKAAPEPATATVQPTKRKATTRTRDLVQ